MPRDFFDYVLRPEMQTLLGHFSSLLDVRIGFFSLDGQELFVGQNRPACTYCARLRASPDFDARCRVLDRRMFARSRRQGGPVSYTCHGGLTEAVVPVMRHERCLGFIMIGQFRTRENRFPAPASRGPATGKTTAYTTLPRTLAQLFRRTPEFSLLGLPRKTGEKVRQLL